MNISFGAKILLEMNHIRATIVTYVNAVDWPKINQPPHTINLRCAKYDVLELIEQA